MRVIAGEYRSRLLCTLDGSNTRPTLDKVKGAVFSKIGYNISNSKFLDLFSGSGSIGIEALSRGAKLVVLNDMNKDANNIIKKNLVMLKASNYELYQLSYKILIDKLSNYQFDYIYLDPPFNDVDYNDLLNLISNSTLMSPNCLVIIESSVELKLNINYNHLVQMKSVKYGKIKISYYKNEE